MSTSSDAADQVVKFSLDGFEVIAKLSGTGAKNIAAMLYAIMKDKKQTKGKTRIVNMLKTGKPLKIFSVKQEDLEVFAKEAKVYGIQYCALMNRKNKDLDGMVDIMVKDEDSSRINRIVERFKLATTKEVDVRTEVVKAIDERNEKKGQNPNDKGVQEKSKEEQLEDILAHKPIQKEEVSQENFNLAKTEKSPLSERTSKTLAMSEGVSKPITKKSVRKELEMYKEQIRSEADTKARENEKATTKENKNTRVPSSNIKKTTRTDRRQSGRKTNSKTR